MCNLICNSYTVQCSRKCYFAFVHISNAQIKTEQWQKHHPIAPGTRKLMFSTKHKTPLSRSQIKRYCDVLGVPVNSSVAKVKQAFYKKSFTLHPDRNKSSGAGVKFNEVSEAYQALLIHKKLGGQDQVNDFSTWQQSKTIRPWYQARARSRQQAHHKHRSASASSQHEEVFQGWDTKSDSQTNSNAPSSYAAHWCDAFFKKQMQEDFAHNRRKRYEKLQPKKKDDTCSIM